MNVNGVKEKKMVAVIEVSGAIFLNDDIGNFDLSNENYRGAGMKFLPFTISLSDDGRQKISASLFAIRSHLETIMLQL